MGIGYLLCYDLSTFTLKKTIWTTFQNQRDWKKSCREILILSLCIIYSVTQTYTALKHTWHCEVEISNIFLCFCETFLRTPFSECIILPTNVTLNLFSVYTFFLTKGTEFFPRIQIILFLSPCNQVKKTFDILNLDCLI